MVQGGGRGEQRRRRPGQDGVQTAPQRGRRRRTPGGVEVGQDPPEGEREGAREVVRDVRFAAVRRDDLAAQRLQFGQQVGQRHEVEVARLAVGHPPLAQQRAERAVGVGDFDEEVSAGPQGHQGGAQFLARVGGVLQMVEHADDVVAGAQPAGDPGIAEAGRDGPPRPARPPSPCRRGGWGRVRRRRCTGGPPWRRPGSSRARCRRRASSPVRRTAAARGRRRGVEPLLPRAPSSRSVRLSSVSWKSRW